MQPVAIALRVCMGRGLKLLMLLRTGMSARRSLRG